MSAGEALITMCEVEIVGAKEILLWDLALAGQRAEALICNYGWSNPAQCPPSGMA